MAKRISALAGVCQPQRFGAEATVGVRLSVIEALTLYQIAAWPDCLAAVGAQAAVLIELDSTAAPQPCSAAASADGERALLRVEPLKWWLIGRDLAVLPELNLAPEQGSTLDLSHSRTWIRLSGADAATLLNRFLPLNLSEAAFPVNSVAASAIHHVGVTLWRSQHGYELLLPRGFALSLWQMLLAGAAQFGAEVI